MDHSLFAVLPASSPQWRDDRARPHTCPWTYHRSSHNPAIMQRSLGIFLLLACALCGCSVRVPVVPEVARDQQPHAAPTQAWVGKGRLEVVAPGKRLSGSAIVRGMGDGSVRAAFISDEGLLLVDFTAQNGDYTVNKAIKDMEQALPHLGRLVAHAYGTISESEHTWDDGRLRATAGDITRWYGGDPVLLRAITGHGLDVLIEDYRFLGNELLAHEARAEGPFGITIRLRLQSARLNPAPTP